PGPAQLVLGPGASGSVTVVVDVPWAPGSDTAAVTALGQTHGGADSATLASTASSTYWGPIASEPNSGRMDNVLGAWDGKVWSITGYGANLQVRSYNPATDAWTVVGTPPTFGGNYARSGCQAGSKVYMYGDTSTSGFTGLWSYDMAAGTWLQEAPGGTAPAQTGIWAPAWASDAETGYCYLTGGATAPGGGNLATVYVYDPASNAWLTPLASFTSVRDFHAAWVFRDATNRKLLCVAGGSNGAGMASTQCYDFTAGTWGAENADIGQLPATLWAMGYARKVHEGATQIWVTGGVRAEVLTAATSFFDVVAGAWANDGNLPSGAVYRTGAVTLDNEIYNLGGSVGSFTYTGLASHHIQCSAPPNIDVSPLTLGATQPPNSTTGQPLTIANTGVGDLTWSLVEEPGGGATACSAPSDVPWLSALETSGTVGGGASTVFDVLYNSTGLADGVYTANLCISSNDPDPGPGNESELVIVPVTLTVESPQVPAITLAKTVGTVPGVCAATTSITVSAGTQVFYCFQATNTGNVTLNLHDLTDSNLGSILSAFPYVLAPGASSPQVIVPDTPTATVTNTATWTAYNTAPIDGVTAEASATVTVTFPNIDVDPLSLASTQLPGTTTTQPLSIGNTGASDLTWTIAEEPALSRPTVLRGQGNAADGRGRSTAPPELAARQGAAAASAGGVARDDVGEPEPPGPPAPTGSIETWQRPLAVLWDNGPLVTHPGGGAGGADESRLQSTSLGMNTIGFGHQVLNNNWVADDFTVSDPVGWMLDTAVFFAYQTNSTTTSTMTNVNWILHDGDPSAGGAVITTGSGLVSSVWTSIYRTSETTIGATNRPIMATTVSMAGLYLPAGTYWLAWQTDGTLASGPWAPPITILGQATTGNGLQSLAGTTAWTPANDTGTNTPRQGFPFVLTGTVGAPVCANPADIPWLSVTPLAGTVAPAGSQPLNVGFDSTGLTPGSYNGNLCVLSNDPDPGPGNESELVIVPVTLTVESPQVPAITLAKTVGTTPGVCAATTAISVDPGTTVYYCYTVTNTGNVTLNLHDLADDQLGTLFSGLNYALTPGSGVDTVAAGLSIPAVINTTTTNTATWTGYNAGSTDTATAQASATVTVVVAPSITLTKTVGTTSGVCATTSSISVTAGTTVYYCYEVTNTGNTTLNLHDLTDDQLGTLFTGFNYALTPGSSVNTVAAGLSIPAVITTTTTNTATWTGYNAGPTDTATAQASATVTALLPANVTGTKTVSGMYIPGGTITYTIVLANSGPGPQPDDPASDELLDVLPASLTATNAAATSGSVLRVGNQVTWNGVIPAGGSVTITITATINAVPGGTQISNQGTINYDSTGHGLNDATRLTDDPVPAGSADPTVFTVRQVDPIPMLDGTGLPLLIVLLAGVAVLYLRRIA
ncbi:MAG: DUF11 domain-containing protein, partial [Thermoanaerobaculaceae bacterium]|nr:DUF11 domain-containing protein [Thermoanaerobaculaceae bacterium]